MSSTRQNTFSDAALERLLDSTLPAKYALMDCLGPNDIIQDGFYDAGRVSFFQPEVFSLVGNAMLPF